MNKDRVTPNRDARILPFRPRGGALHGVRDWHWPRGMTPQGPPAVADLAKFERTDQVDDYRHRMIVNALALIFTCLLVAAGVWLALKMAEMRKDQDCFLSGRRNCTPIEVPVNQR